MFFDDVPFAPVEVDDFPGIAQTDARMPQTMEPGTLGRPIVMKKIMKQAAPGGRYIVAGKPFGDNVAQPGDIQGMVKTGLVPVVLEIGETPQLLFLE